VSDYALHPAALADIDEIWHYIARDDFDAADRAIETIFENIATLARSPQQGHRRRDLMSAPLVFWRVYRYLIAYAPDERPLWVVAVIHGQPSPRVMAAMLREREQA
jgi:plasmid stabilization system protein ParE